MKLQINDSGSWRNIVSFERHNLALIQDTSRQMMSHSSNTHVKLRIIEEGHTDALGYCVYSPMWEQWQWTDARFKSLTEPEGDKGQ